MNLEQALSIKQIADQVGISVDTIRYYEKIGLLPRAERKDNGHRVYKQTDIYTIQLISCLKKTGMPLEEMRPFLMVSTDTDPSEHPDLVELLRNHRETIVSQITSLQQVVHFIDMKLQEGSYSQACSGSGSLSEKLTEALKAKSVSAEEMSYFSSSAKAAKSLRYNK